MSDLTPQLKMATGTGNVNEASIRANQNTINAAMGALNGPSGTAIPKANPPQAIDRVKPGAKYGDRPGEKRLDVKNMNFKKGTKRVPRTGLAKVHKGERIIPAKNNPRVGSKRDKVLTRVVNGKIRKTRIINA